MIKNHRNNLAFLRFLFSLAIAAAQFIGRI